LGIRYSWGHEEEDRAVRLVFEREST
jgi:hypothetical protein